MLLPYLLELDGKLAGRFFALNMGSTGAVTVRHSNPSSKFVIGTPDPSPGAWTLTCGAGMSATFYKWLTVDNTRKSGAVIALDSKSNVMGRHVFYDALVTSVTLPKLDSNGKEAGALTVTIRPDSISHEKQGKLDLGVYAGALPRAWHTNDFGVSISGLESDCKYVTRISSLNMSRKVKTFVAGSSRRPEMVATAAEYSDIVLELQLSHAEGFVKWHEGTLTGRNSEKDGEIEFMAPGSAKAYFTVNLLGLGLMAVQVDRPQIKDHFKTARIEMYCTSISLQAESTAII